MINGMISRWTALQLRQGIRGIIYYNQCLEAQAITYLIVLLLLYQASVYFRTSLKLRQVELEFLPSKHRIY